jgi:hypothetical protein
MFKKKRRVQSDFSEELQAHLDLETDRLRAEGLGGPDAYREARRNLGNLAGAGERFYESSRWLWLEHLTHDTRHALRRLRKAPVFAITAILTLALGIGATTAIFTLVHAVLLRSLAVQDPNQLFRLGRETHCCVWNGYSQDKEFSIVSYDLYKHFRDNTKGFAELAAFEAGEVLLGVRRAHSSNAAVGSAGEFISGNYFAMFGVKAYAGRTITPDDDRSGCYAGGHDELSTVASEVRSGSIGDRRRVHSERSASPHRRHRSSKLLRRYPARDAARFLHAARH